MTDSRSGRRSFDSKLISLLPLDEVPVHVHPFAARAPCDWKGSQCQCGIHTAEAASALRSRKTERAAKEKPTPISHFFLAPAAPKVPQLAATTWGGSPPRPLCQKICYSDCTKNCPLRPLGAPRRFRNPKIGQQLGAQPTPRFRVMIDALLDALLDALARCTARLPLDEVPVHVHPFAARAPCDSKGSECQCGIHRAEAASALRSRKTERAAKEKPTPISHIFFSTFFAWHPNSPPGPGEAPHPAPSARKSVIRLHKKLPSVPLRAPRRFRNPKIGQQLGAQPTPRFRWKV